MAPTMKVRLAVRSRDRGRCVACGSVTDLTFQHRRAVGMGGSQSRPDAVDGLSLCLGCNTAAEGSMQTLALCYGWKVRRWADPVKVPVYYPHEFQWSRLEDSDRVLITAVVALDHMHAVYGDTYFRWRDDG